MASPTSNQPTGMRAFMVIWLGQLVSLLGTAMTQFALTIWAFEETGQATTLALIGVAFMTPLLLLSPFAGAIVDRSNRKLMMIISDAGAGVSTIVVLLLFMTGRLDIWHLYITAVLTGATQSFQWPAFSSAISTMVPKEHYGRVHGLNSLSENGSSVFAPVAAAALLALTDIQTILLIDVVTFSVAIGTLLWANIPQPDVTEEGEESRGSLWQESLYGFHYIWKRPSLLGLQLVFLFGNFFATMVYTLLPAMILARTSNNELVLGSTQSAGAIGGVLGGLLMSAWGGPKRLIHGVLLGWILSGLTTLPLGLSQSPTVWGIALLAGGLVVPLINGSNQALWQRKVAPDVQGRVFSIRRMIAWLVNPLAMLIVGPLADFVFEPGMMENGRFAPILGGLVGTGPGAGMAFIIFVASFMTLLIGGLGYLFTAVRQAEDLLPDHQQLVPSSD